MTQYINITHIYVYIHSMTCEYKEKQIMINIEMKNNVFLSYFI